MSNAVIDMLMAAKIICVIFKINPFVDAANAVSITFIECGRGNQYERQQDEAR